MGEESTSPRDTPSPTPPLAPPDFGFGSEWAKKESLTPSPPSCLEKKIDALRASCPCWVFSLTLLGGFMDSSELTFSHYERRYDDGGWMYLVAVYRDNNGRKYVVPVD